MNLEKKTLVVFPCDAAFPGVGRCCKQRDHEGKHKRGAIEWYAPAGEVADHEPAEGHDGPRAA